MCSKQKSKMDPKILTSLGIYMPYPLAQVGPVDKVEGFHSYD